MVAVFIFFLLCSFQSRKRPSVCSAGWTFDLSCLWHFGSVTVVTFSRMSCGAHMTRGVDLLTPLSVLTRCLGPFVLLGLSILFTLWHCQFFVMVFLAAILGIGRGCLAFLCTSVMTNGEMYLFIFYWPLEIFCEVPMWGCVSDL